jgi:hypothetical protein
METSRECLAPILTAVDACTRGHAVQLRSPAFVCLIAIFSFFVTSLASSAEPEPKKHVRRLDLKGIVVGAPATEQQIREALDISCDSRIICEGNTWSFAPPRGAHIEIEFHDENVDEITVDFDQNRYKQVADACGRKYGKPTLQYEQTLQNGFGKTIRNLVTMWEAGDGSQAVLSHYSSSDPDDSKLLLISARNVKENDEARKRKLSL